jgi:xanthine dehydrogenase accessory factor
VTTALQTLYARLLKSLHEENEAAIISVYGADGTVDKSLAHPRDARSWAHAVELTARPSAQTFGPVTSLSAPDGSLTVVEHYTNRPRLIILGAGHIALALTRMACLADFEIVVFDDRPSFANSERFPEADAVICDSFERLFERVQLRGTDYVVVVTRGHQHDATCLAGVLSGPEPAYTGMIGSKRRVAIVMSGLREDGYDEERIARIHSPIGLRIGAITPAEIAVSIMAEIVQVKRTERGEGFAVSCDLEVVRALGSGSGEADALITIYETTGSVPIDSGAKLAMTYEGSLIGTIGGGCSEAETLQVAREVIRTGLWRTHLVDMSDSAEGDGMVCGGEMRVIIEPL